VYLYLCLVPLRASPVALRSQTALTVILLGFNNGRAGRMAAHGQRRTALSQRGELPGVRASSAAAVGFALTPISTQEVRRNF